MNDSAKHFFKKITALSLRLKQTACAGIDSDDHGVKLDAVLEGQLSIAAIFQTFGELLTGQDSTKETLSFLDAQLAAIVKEQSNRNQ